MWREPLVHFLGLAALLFVANALFSGDERELITVDVSTQEYIIQQRQDLMLRDMDDEEKRAAVEDFIDEEILVREARKQGLENSPRIRALLIQNMRLFMASEAPDPTEEDLRAFFDENAELFSTKPTVTYEHVYFSDPDAAPADILETLRSGADYRQIGDADSLSSRLIGITDRQILANFGRQQAPRILSIDDEQWHGPFTTANGLHFLRISERHPGQRPVFEAARSWIEQEWLAAKIREIVERKLGAMRESYRIEVLRPGKESL